MRFKERLVSVSAWVSKTNADKKQHTRDFPEKSETKSTRSHLDKVELDFGNKLSSVLLANPGFMLSFQQGPSETKDRPSHKHIQAKMETLSKTPNSIM